MANYCDETRLRSVFGGNVDKWGDMTGNKDAEEISARVDVALTVATEMIDNRLRGSMYSVPFTGTIPQELQDICANLAGVWLYESRGIQDIDPETGRSVHRLWFNKREALRKLRDMKAGILKLPGFGAHRTTPKVHKKPLRYDSESIVEGNS